MLLFGNVLVYRAIFAPYVLTVSVLEVGKGNAALIRTPNGTSVLIDTGPDASILRALGAILPPWQRNIDAVVLTSTKKAFAGGLPDVLSRYHVSHTFSSGTHFVLDNTISIDILAPNTFRISYDTTSLFISSSTKKGLYILDEKQRGGN